METLENGYMKRGLVESNARRIREIETGRRVVVGVNRFTEGEPSPLTAGLPETFLTVDDAVENEQIEALRDFRSRRDGAAAARALDRLRESVLRDLAWLLNATQLEAVRCPWAPPGWDAMPECDLLVREVRA